MSVGTTYGKYFLLKKLAAGGMGEVFLARQQGPAGFEKVVVIKRILDYLTDNPDYMEAFLQEARLQARMSHSSIVQIFDLGKADDDSFYLAMEYVNGKSLVEVINRLRNRKERMPPAFVAQVIERAADGLAYAHNMTDNGGRSLNIIHRDISPHNILISYQGDVKLIDFGIAKSEINVVKTETGTIKGKFYYMSPEQSAAKKLDKRSDIFSLGIVLYECLANENPFYNNNVVLTLEAIQKFEPPPPSSIDPVLAPFDAIIAKALSKKVEGRYADASDLKDDLGRIRGQLPNPPERLGAYVTRLFKDKVEAEARVLFDTDSASLEALEAASSAIPPRQPAPKSSTSSARTRQPTSSQPRPATPTPRPRPEPAPKPALEILQDPEPEVDGANALAPDQGTIVGHRVEEPAPDEQVDDLDAIKPSRTGLWIGVILGLGVLGAAAYFLIIQPKLAARVVSEAPVTTVTPSPAPTPTPTPPVANPKAAEDKQKAEADEAKQKPEAKAREDEKAKAAEQAKVDEAKAQADEKKRAADEEKAKKEADKLAKNDEAKRQADDKKRASEEEKAKKDADRLAKAADAKRQAEEAKKLEDAKRAEEARKQAERAKAEEAKQPPVAKKVGAVLVRSTPPGEVKVNGRTLSGAKADLTGSSGNIDVNIDGAPFKIRLAYDESSFELQSDPWAIIYVNGLSKGKTPARLPFAEETLRVDFKRPGVDQTVQLILRYSKP